MAKGLTLSIQKFIAKCEDRQDKFVRQFVQEMLFEMVAGKEGESPGTPVATGFARASWYIALNDLSPDKEIPKGQKIEWEAFLNQGVLKCQNAKMGDTIYILNNAKYILALEYGHSAQAPNGMVRITFQNYQRIAEDVLKRLNS